MGNDFLPFAIESGPRLKEAAFKLSGSLLEMCHAECLQLSGNLQKSDSHFANKPSFFVAFCKTVNPNFLENQAGVLARRKRETAPKKWSGT